MKKLVLTILICGFMVLSITGCGTNLYNNSSNNTNNETSDYDSQTTNTSENNANSEFEKAIKNYKNAKSISIELNSESTELNSDYATKRREEILIDYKNNLIDVHTTYSYNSLFPSSDKAVDYHTYYDIKTNRVYTYDHQCKTWYYYNSSYKEDNRYLKYLDRILYLNENDAKKVGNNYHFGSQDIMIDHDNITWFRLDDTGSQKVSENVEYTFKSFNNTVVSLPDEVKNALSEREIDKVCDN